MADDTPAPTTAAGKTQYRILRKLTAEQVQELSIDAEIYVLEPKSYEGNVRRAVYEDLGEGDYIKVAARSLDPFVVRTKEVVTFK